MANWAKLQEDLTGLPVVKRARHSIHFDKGNGEIVANFSGKPCHFQDTDGLWKPIDTKLLLGNDGFYGCPHSPVKVHKDGRVKVDKSNYSQFTELPGSPVGKVDGDHIVREFPGGYQELFVTEDGFREVITVVKRTFPIEKFLAKQSGTLPSAYKASPQTAVDANGNEFVITADTKAFGDLLEGAVYPVTIDPDFSVQPDETSSMDTYIGSYSAYQNRNYGISTKILVDEVSGDINRGLIKFDLSSISTGAEVSAGALSIYQTSASTETQIKFHRSLVQWYEGNKAGAALDAGVDGSTWDYRNNNGAVAWEGGEGGVAGSDYATDATDTETVNNGSATTLGITDDCAYWVANPSSNYGGWLLRVETSKYTEFASSGYATESYRPVLTVTYTTGGALRRINTSSFQQLTGGMHG